MIWGWFWERLESSGGQTEALEALETPQSENFEDVSGHLLDSGRPGTGRAMVVGAIPAVLAP